MGMAAVEGYALVGVEARRVRVEAHVRSGLPGMTIVGLPSTAVREASERIRSGAASSGVPLPTQRITVNLPPADLRKEGSGFDLPVALAVLAASGYVPDGSPESFGAVGEVGLDGSLRPVPGALAAGEAAGSSDIDLLLVPQVNLLQAAEVAPDKALGVTCLREALEAMRAPAFAEHLRRRSQRWLALARRREGLVREAVPDLRDVAGQQQAKRALEVAAAGGHHLLLSGPPGVGKTMLARRLPGLLPPLEHQEALEVTRIHSVAGYWGRLTGLVRERPFRAPHHTISRAALVGGGPGPRPGELSLAHHGVLFLDELPEFSRDCLEALRQPLEEGCLVVSRQQATYLFPARVTLVAAMNPCPCGYLCHPDRECTCTGDRLQRYHDRLSGPLLDRVDLQVPVLPLRPGMLDRDETLEPSALVRERVVAAREFRREQEARRGDGSAPDSLHPSSLATQSLLGEGARRLLAQAVTKGVIGGRGYTRTLRVARTLADLDASPCIDERHAAEALSLRVGA